MEQGSHRYHHGDLRQALIQAGIELIAERGVSALSLREVARRAGVSHNAPYNHFADKAALLAALVEHGFARLEAALDDAYRAAQGSPLDRVSATGAAYVRFAVTHPALFRLMFRPELRAQASEQAPPMEPTPFHNPKGALNVLLKGLREGQEAGVIVEGDATRLALAAWSLIHGVTVLLLDGNMAALAPTPDAATALAHHVTGVLRAGLEPR